MEPHMELWNAPHRDVKITVVRVFKAIGCITFIITRPKRPYGRQGLAGSWSKYRVGQVHFEVLLRSSKNAIGRLEKDFNLNAVLKSR